jgi:hypothetical protein
MAVPCGMSDSLPVSMTGTHRGELMGIKPTNRRTVTHGCSVGQLKNGKAVHGARTIGVARRSFSRDVVNRRARQRCASLPAVQR